MNGGFADSSAPGCSQWTAEGNREPAGDGSEDVDGADGAGRDGYGWQRMLEELKDCPWYWGDLSWRDAERLLLLCEEGVFLLRDSRSDTHLFTISHLQSGRVFHTRLEITGSVAHLGGPLSPEKSASIVALLERAMKVSNRDDMHMLMHRRGGEAEAAVIHIRRPLSRFELAPSLQYFCRLQIRRRCPASLVHTLPSVGNVGRYLFSRKYLIPNIDAGMEVLKRRRQLQVAEDAGNCLEEDNELRP